MNQSKPLHPAYEELVLLSVGELAEPRATEVREHLLDCQECLEKTRALLRLPDSAPTPEEEVTAAEEAAAWRRLKAAVAAEEGKEAAAVAKPVPAPPAPLPFRRPAEHQPRSKWSLPLAALLAGGIGLLVGRVTAVPPQPPVEEGKLTDRRSATATTHLIPAEFVDRGNSELPGVECPAAGGSFVWIMPFTQRPEAAEKARLIIEDARGQVLDSGDYPINGDGQVVLSLDSTLLKDGDYTIRLEASKNGEDAREEFPISIACR